MDQHLHQCADILLAIEAELRRIALWESTPPSGEALASLVPFCYDTMAFHQWLQWVFVPQMKRVLESDQGWPSTSNIFPMAEHAFSELDADTGELLLLLKQFDNFINRLSL